ncbi:uncharacterized protein [Aristolochia californica]|uniref:uncharacterized protein n=1 Tax=Aristolochia californica TaxID=171875 RepID=UPI0035D91A06
MIFFFPEESESTSRNDLTHSSSSSSSNLSFFLFRFFRFSPSLHFNHKNLPLCLVSLIVQSFRFFLPFPWSLCSFLLPDFSFGARMMERPSEETKSMAVLDVGSPAGNGVLDGDGKEEKEEGNRFGNRFEEQGREVHGSGEEELTRLDRLENRLSGKEGMTEQSRAESRLPGGREPGEDEVDEALSDGNLSDVDIGNEEPDTEKPLEALTETNGCDEKVAGDLPLNGAPDVFWSPSHFPQPNPPPGIVKPESNGDAHRMMDRSLSDRGQNDVTSLGKYFRDRSNSFSTALKKRISSFKEGAEQQKDSSEFTEIHLHGLKVTVQLKQEDDFKGRISFFSRSNCRDCSAVRTFFRDKGLKFVEINIDVFPGREKELIERTGSSMVPQIFLNEKLLGGLTVLNSLRNSGEFDKKVKEIAGKRCPDSAPSPPVYGFDDDQEEERTDEMVGIVRLLRQRLPIQDRLTKMKIVKNCFSGREMVEAIIQHLDCGRKKAVEIGKVLARKHFIHHVFRENDFEDGNHLYRFLEHEPTIPRCFNFRGMTNDEEPKLAAAVGRKLTKIMSAVLEAYASDDRRHVDYARISKSEEFRRYVNLAQDLQRVNVAELSQNERLAFFLILYNAMVIHAVIRVGSPEGVIDRRTFYGDFHYIIGGYPYSLTTIKNGILRSNRRQPYSLTRPFGAGDKRLQVALPKVNPLIHFGLCNGTRSSPTVRIFSAEGIEAELRFAAREFFLGRGIEIDLVKRIVYLTRIIKWYNVDFVEQKEILKWIIDYLDASKAGLLTHLLRDGGPVSIVYQDYDWSLNT